LELVPDAHWNVRELIQSIKRQDFEEPLIIIYFVVDISLHVNSNNVFSHRFVFRI
jgi:hypothetical protein